MVRAAVVINLVATATAAGAAALGASAISTDRTATVCSPYLNVPRESMPLASRDGRVLVWTQRTFRSLAAAVHVSAPDGSGARRILPARNVVDGLAIAPDGSEVLVRGHDRSTVHWTLASTLVPTHRRVSAQEAREIRRRWRTPEWSPDGGFAAEGRVDGLWLVSANGASERQLVDLPSVWGPAWSEDGTQIAFGVAAAGDAGSDLYVVNADGTGLRRLTEARSVVGLSWSPDGRWIAFADNRSQYHEGSAIAVIRPDGRGLRYLTRPLEGPDRRSAGYVSWLGATRLVFVSDERRQGRRKVAGIHSIGLDGRGERRVTYHCHLGTTAGDVLRGSILGDTLRSLAGADVVLPGPGRDDVDSGAGADVIRARDGERDLIRCGPGRDTVLADRRDVVRGCERVRLR